METKKKKMIAGLALVGASVLAGATALILKKKKGSLKNKENKNQELKEEN